MKLVRDFIPNIDTSGLYAYRQAAPAEYSSLLHAKLREEVEEFLARPCLDEYVDIIEVIGALSHFYGFAADPGRVDAYANLKRSKNGSFYSMVVQEGKERKTAVLGLPDAPGAIDTPGEDQGSISRGRRASEQAG